MKKAERIRNLYADGLLTVNEIAALVGCSPEYVRVAARQRAGGRPSKAQLAFEARRSVGRDIEEARRMGRVAYQAARGAGASRIKASHAYQTAWRVAMGLLNG